MKNQPLLNERQAAELLGVTVSALRRWRRESRGPSYFKLEKCIRYDLDALKKYLHLNCSDPTQCTSRESAIGGA